VRELPSRRPAYQGFASSHKSPHQEAVESASGIARITRWKTTKRIQSSGGGSVSAAAKDNLSYVELGRIQRRAKQRRVREGGYLEARAIKRQAREEYQEWQRRAEQRRVRQEDEDEERRVRSNLFHHRCLAWRPSLAGDNHPPWWSFPAIELVNSPFRNTPWILSAAPRFPLERQIFHREGCTCPKGYPSPCFPDPSRHTANAIYLEVNQEFDRRFAAAQIQTTSCSASQDLWKVLHYCKFTERHIPRNHVGRTRGGRWVGQLLHQEVYDHLAHDCLRFLHPQTADFARSCALRIIPRIIEHCVFRLGHIGPGGPARPIPGSWGYSSVCHRTILRYVEQKNQFPREQRLNFKIYEFGKGGSVR
jgi:hypothetical protein